MASDLSNIIKSEICNTLESLLSTSVSIADIKPTSTNDLVDQQCICIDTNFEFSNFKSVNWKFYIPSKAATKFEFMMLGGIGDLKEVIDDEIADAVNEIVSNICGSMTTPINAQAFDDLGTVSFAIAGNKIVQCDENPSIDNMFKFDITLGDDDIIIFIEFSPESLPYLSMISTGIQGAPTEEASASVPLDTTSAVANNAISSLLGDESVENLKLLFDIKFKLSVRLGTKVLLLKDVMGWDTGTIIELEQMVNEPLDILVNGIQIGKGEAVIVEGKFGIKIKYIGNERLS